MQRPLPNHFSSGPPFPRVVLLKCHPSYGMVVLKRPRHSCSTHDTICHSSDKGTTSATASRAEERRKELEREVEEYLRIVTALRACINSLVLIACLPPEVLGHIFLCYAALMKAASEREIVQYHSLSSTLDWLAITHICHYWREVALSTPQLWTDIVLHHENTDRVQEFIACSKQALLKIQIIGAANIATPVLQNICKEVGRATTL